MNCTEVLSRRQRISPLNFNNYTYLRGARNVVESLWARGFSGVEARPEDSFEPFIFTWIALNAWGECVSSEQTDAGWVRAVSCDVPLGTQFDALVNQSHSRLRQSLEEFVRFWPIPRVQHWRRNRPHAYPEFDSAHRARFFSDNRIQMQPLCWLDHYERGEPVPLDWCHFLHTAYQVRCNLFHGDKSPSDAADQRIVHSVFLTLVYFLQSCEEFAPARYEPRPGLHSI